MDELILPYFWYFIIGISVILYAVLDGFDLGVGMLHPFVKKDIDRRIFLNAIGPVWDGNEVWLVIVLGGLLAGFPPVYAMMLSSFYNLCMFLLLCLIFRAVSIEFRSKQESKRWRATWDYSFSIASYFISFVIGLILGNLIIGVPLDEYGNFIGSFSDFFSIYPILVGFMAIGLFLMHGSIYLVMKTEGELYKRVRRWVLPCILIFVATYLIVTFSTFAFQPHMIERMFDNPEFFVLPLMAALAIANVPRLIKKKYDGLAFVFSCLAIAFLMTLFSVGTFPALVRSTVSPETNSLTIYNSASSFLTLKVLAIIVVIGVPLVLAYGYYIYRVFSGKVKLGPTSY
jgi:cytochrome bd ubiquinol oxidase subunit II